MKNHTASRFCKSVFNFVVLHLLLRILLPLTFFMGISLEVYVTKPNNIEDLKQRISHEIRQITPEMLQNVRDACYYRFAIFQEKNGTHFEH
jgi:hypothetical protein